jgi:hypothetical protein
MAAPEPTLAGRRGLEMRNVWQRWSSTQQGDNARGYRPHGSTRADLNKEVRSGAAGHVAALKPTSAGRCGLRLQLTWQHVDARPAHCLDLELVCRGTRSSGCRQRPPSPHREATNLQLGPIFWCPARLSYLFTLQSTVGSWEVPELKVRECPPPM